VDNCYYAAMRPKTLSKGSKGALSLLVVLGTLCGCSWKEIFPPDTPTLANAAAVDRALELCAPTHGNQPFHLKLRVTPPSRDGENSVLDPQASSAMQAQVEVYWLNAITYRTEIHAPGFSQTRIVNGSVVEEHNSGDFYPRWLQNFVDAVLEPVPKAALLRRQPGSVPVSLESHACISGPEGDETQNAQVCFQNTEPRLASGLDFTRYVSFDDFAPFGAQQVARTLVNVLPSDILVHGNITTLEPLQQSAYPKLKATQFTQPSDQIRTHLISRSMARAMLDTASTQQPQARLVSYTPSSEPAGELQDHIMMYIRTDRTGRVREAYPDIEDVYGQHRAAISHALTLRFKPLLVNGAPQQMEAPLELP
jgi:hypothetical protein